MTDSMDQQSPAGGKASHCSLCDCIACGGLWYYTFCDDRDGQHRIVGHSFGKGGFSQHQDCDKCSLGNSPASCAFTVHNSDTGLEIELCDALANHISHVIHGDADNGRHFGFFQLRLISDILKQNYDPGPTANNGFSETNFMLAMLLEGLDSDTIFLEPFKVDYGDVLRLTKLERGLHELELLGPDSNANDDIRDSDGFHRNSTEPTHNFQDDIFLVMNNVRQAINDIVGLRDELIVRSTEYLTLAKSLRLCPSPKLYSPRQPSRAAAPATPVRSMIIKEFGEEYHRVVNKTRLGEIAKRFQNPTRAWRCGVDTLRKISHGRLVRDLGCVIAMLCVCSAMSRTLDQNYPSNKFYDYKDSYFGHFKNDLHQWGLLYKNPHSCTPSCGMSSMSCEVNCDLHRFIGAVKTVWDVDTESRILGEQTIGFFDDDLVRYFKDLVSKLVLDLDDILYPINGSDDELGEARCPSPMQQIHQPRKLSLNGPAGRYTWPHRLKAMDPVLAVLLTGAIFLILFIFLTWLCALAAGHNAPDVLLEANFILTQAERKNETFLDRVRCANEVLRTFFEIYDEVSHLDIAYTGRNQRGIVVNQEVIPSHSPVLHPTPATRHSQAPEIARKMNQISTPDKNSTHRVNRQFSCTEPGCPKTYTHSQGLDKHMRNAHRPKERCKHCKKSYTRDGFKNHNCTNTYEEPSSPLPKRRKISNAELDM